MKKLFIAVGLTLLLAVAPVYADSTGGGGIAVSGDYTGSASFSGYPGTYNDFGIAGGYGETGASFGYTADGTRFVQGAGIAIANDPDMKSWSWAKDNYDTRSSSGAGAKMETDCGSDFAAAEAIGSNGFFKPGDATTSVGVSVYGNLSESSMAAEQGRFGANGIATQGAGLEFAASDQDTNGDLFGISANHMHGLNTEAIVKGKTVVEVDPYGSNRSAFASTENEANVDAEHLNFSRVAGSGMVGVDTQNGFGSYGKAGAGFGYTGYTQGAGAAQAETNLNSNSVTSTASSWAGSN